MAAKKRATAKLWSCPYCGSDRLATRGVSTPSHEGSAVECDSCGASGPIETTARRANGSWNVVARKVAVE